MRRIAFLSSLLVVLCLAAPARSVTVPVGPPVIDTTITAGPLEGATIEDDGVAFSFVATRDGQPFPTASFECSLDASPFTPCSTPKEIDGLANGGHVFTVAASDPESKAVDPEPATRSFTIAEPAECEDEGEAEEDEGDFEFEEAEEASEGACGEGSEAGSAPRECLLRSADARLSAYPAQERVHLVLRYTAFAPTDAVVSLRTGRGAPKLLESHRHLARQGVLRLTESLNRDETARVRLARRFTVEALVPAAPALCHRYDNRHLAERHATRNRVSWTQSDSIFGAGD